jgi:molybdopterin biosynthesis enzyme
MIAYTPIELDDAISSIARQAQPLPAERVALRNALGRRLAEDGPGRGAPHALELLADGRPH